MVASDSLRRVTLAELVATLSLMADLGMGRPMERALRQTVVAMRLGAAAGMDGAACASAYYTSLLTWVGCAVDTSEVAALFGDEMEFYAETRDEDLGGVTLAVFVARHLGAGADSAALANHLHSFLGSQHRSRPAGSRAGAGRGIDDLPRPAGVTGSELPPHYQRSAASRL